MAAIGTLLTAGLAWSQDDWARQKCSLYAEGWEWVLQTQDLADVSAAFIEDHRAFIDADCDHALKICPLTGGDHLLADLLTVISMNEGMASTFVPFACPAPDSDPATQSRFGHQGLSAAAIVRTKNEVNPE
mgnify:CR=1 FL=1